MTTYKKKESNKQGTRTTETFNNLCDSNHAANKIVGKRELH